jgi:cytochrome c551/c552
MKKFLIPFLLFTFYVACSDSQEKAASSAQSVSNADETVQKENPSYDPDRGTGKYKDVVVDQKLNVGIAKHGEKSFGVKCSSCHKLTNERLVGPGWKGVTSRYKPEWILNFMTNTDEMINKDPKVQAQLEICLVRMPNQNLSDEEAKSLYEFMRKNDGVK